MVRTLVAAMAALMAAALVGGAGASVTGFDPDGTVVLDGAKVFPIILAKGPDPGSKAPDGADAFATVKAAGVTLLKIGPATVPWTASDIADANTQDRAASAAGLGTWVNLSTVSQATAGSSGDTLLQQVEKDRCGAALEKALARRSRLRTRCDFLDRASAGNKAYNFQFGQRRIRTHS